MLFKIDQRLIYNDLAKTIILNISKREKGLVLIISAGTADIQLQMRLQKLQTFVEQILKKYMMLVLLVFIDLRLIIKDTRS